MEEMNSRIDMTGRRISDPKTVIEATCSKEEFESILGSLPRFVFMCPLVLAE